MKLKNKSNAVRIPPIRKVVKVRRKSSDLGRESTVAKAVKNVRKVLEDKNADSTKKVSMLRVQSCRKKPIKKITKTARKRMRGLVYIGHIPHGFYEEQMEDYFKQFGKVTRVRVSRSKNTGKSRGYGYVEFEHCDVAKIAAETMNNYLMCGRLLKATYVPPEKQHRRFFAGTPWSSEVYPKLINRNATNGLKNRSTRSHKRFVQSTQDSLSALEQKLKSMGVDLTFAMNNTEA